MSLALSILLGCPQEPAQERLPTRPGQECAPATQPETSCAGDTAAYPSECTGPADCDGICAPHPDDAYYHSCTCRQDECLSDADCGPGAACSCTTDPEHGWSVNRCLESDCRSNADCGSGRCQRDRHLGCEGGPLFARGWRCAAPDDECDSDLDCEPGAFCVWSGHFACSDAYATCD